MTSSRVYLNAQTIAARFGCKRPSGTSNGKTVFRFPCPAHGGDDPNLAIWDGDGGSIAARCFSNGCSYQSIIDALGTEYNYEGRKLYRADGSYVHRRRGRGKDFTGNTGSPEALLVVLLHDADGNAIVLCEGPKAAEALAALEIADITTANWDGGSGGVDKADYSPLRGRHAILWPDAGPEGRAIMDKAANSIQDLAKSVKLVDVGELASGQDAADVDRDTAAAILGTAAPYPYKSSELSEWMRSTQAGDETRTAEALLRRCGNRIMIVEYLVSDRHSQARVEARPYYLRDNGLWEENGPELRAQLEAMLSRLRAESWELPPITPHVGGNAVRSQLKRLSDKPDKIIGHLPTIAFLWRDGQVGGWDNVTFAKESELDKDGRYLGTASGVVDLETGNLLPPSEARRFKVTRSTGGRYDAAATHPDIDKLTSHLPEDLSDYLWAVLGRALWGQPDSTFVLVIGPGNAGKTTLFNAVGAALGPEGGTFARDLLRSVRKDVGKDGPTPERAPVIEKRIIWALEAETWVLDGARTKMFAGSEGLISHQPKFRPQGDYPLRATLFVVGNDYPAMPLDDDALARRLRIVEYQKPEDGDEDITLKYRVAGKPQKKAMLARLVRAAKENPPARDPIHIPETIQAKITRRIADAVGDFGQWCGIALVPAPGHRVSTASVWTGWAAYCGVAEDTARIGGVARDKDMVARIRRFKALASRSLRIDGKVTRGFQDWRLAEVGDCSICGGMAPAASLVDLDGRGGVCLECRGDAPPSTGATGDGQPQGFSGMGAATTHPIVLEDALRAELARVEKRRVKGLALLERQGEADPGLSPEVIYENLEQAGTLQAEMLEAPVRVRVAFLNRQAEGLRLLLAALEQEQLTAEEVEAHGGAEHIAKMFKLGTAQPSWPVELANTNTFVGIVRVMRLDAREKLAAHKTLWQRIIDEAKQAIPPRLKEVN